MIYLLLGAIISIVVGIRTGKSNFLLGIAYSTSAFLCALLIYIFIGGAIGVYLPTVEVVEERQLTSADSIQTERRATLPIRENNNMPVIRIHRKRFKETWYYWVAYEGILNEKTYIEFVSPEHTNTGDTSKQ